MAGEEEGIEMSDTPRTDILLVVHDFDPKPDTIINHARQLERELNAANEMFRKLNIHTLNLTDRIKRLEEAGNNLLWNFCPEYTSDFTESQSDALKQWNKAKESMP